MALIKQEALLAEINKWPESVMYKDWVQSAIANASIIDAAPVVHGRWVEKLRCSVCGQVDWSAPNYCPNCGARMDGGEDDG